MGKELNTCLTKQEMSMAWNSMRKNKSIIVKGKDKSGYKGL